jgi:hypothetical protein
MLTRVPFASSASFFWTARCCSPAAMRFFFRRCFTHANLVALALCCAHAVLRLALHAQCMKPGGGGAPPQPLADALAASFGSLDKFKAEFKDAAVAQFGSGWAWLVQEGDSLKARARRRLADCGMPADARRAFFVVLRRSSRRPTR